MRALRVIGLAEDGAVICETEPAGDEKPERFALRADDKLRAAARGDLARLGQIEIELESQMRPREIQARIRAGASVEQVAELAGMPVERVDRFAYPVLLERSRTAELAQRAHPVRDDGPDVRTLGEVITATFTLRGHDVTAVTWDSWRGEDSKWVVQLRWQAGRSDNHAHWTFHPGAHGGTVTVLDDMAADLIDPNSGKPLRTVRPVTTLAEQAMLLEESIGVRPAEARRPEPVRRPEPAPVTAALVTPAPVAAAPVAAAPVVATPAVPTPVAAPPVAPTPVTPAPAAEEPAVAEAEPAPEVVEEAVEVEATGTTEAAPARRSGRNSRPIVPSWEDVLLGVRSNRS